jgi:hypothetical protein
VHVGRARNVISNQHVCAPFNKLFTFTNVNEARYEYYGVLGNPTYIISKSLLSVLRVWQPCEYLRWKDTSGVLYASMIREVTLNPRKINIISLKPFLFHIVNRNFSAYKPDFIVVFRFSVITNEPLIT